MRLILEPHPVIDLRDTGQIMSKNRALVVVLLAVSSLLGGAPAAAQSEITFQVVDVDLWPEYDRPGMLVIYKVTLASEVQLPAAVNFRIPVAAGDPNAVAVRQPDGQLFSAAYERRVQDEWATVSFVATTQGFQLEYYDPAIETEGSDRSFTYVWPANYQVRSLAVEAQQPLGARELRTTPAAASTSTSGEGFVYKHIPLGARMPGDRVEVTVEYVKETDALSVQAMPPAPSMPEAPAAGGLPSDAAAGGGFPAAQVLGALALISAAIVTLLWWQRGRLRSVRGGRGAQVAPRAGRVADRPVAGSLHAAEGSRQATEGKRQGAGGARRAAGDTPPAAGHSFCTQCGARAAEGDRFCHACGTRLQAG